MSTEAVYFYQGTTLKSGYSISSGVISDLLCEGEIEGIVNYEYALSGTRGAIGYSTFSKSTFNFLKSVYFNEEPIIDREGKFNFQNIDIRKVSGQVNGDIDPSTSILKPTVSYTKTISERLRGPTGADADPKTFAKYYRVLNKNISKIQVNIRQASLIKISNGENAVSTVKFNVLCRPVFLTKQQDDTDKNYLDIVNPADKTIFGIFSSTYIRTIELDLTSTISGLNLKSNKDFLGWELQIYRITPEPTTTEERNQSFVDNITEVYDTKLSYPNSAIVYSGFDAEYFSEIPDRYYDVRMTKVKVPSNYDPVLRTYAGNWDGTFKAAKEWTDNPAWCFYDLITNSRYGLGKYLNSDLVDKWSLYKISKYCDELVDDGYGGLEPRFTCNLLIQSREEAFKVINDIASVFRAINYYFAGNIFTIQDSPKSPNYQFTNSNVINGEFTYSNSSRKVRHTVAIVRYNDKNNFYKSAVEYVEDIDGIRKYGYREIEATAFGCTSRGQAIRFGRWMLLTETLETESVNFKTGPEGSLLRPGDVVEVVDSNRKSSARSGRTRQVDNNIPSQTLSVVLDREIKGLDSRTSYNLCLSVPTYTYDSISGAVSNSSLINDIRKEQILKFNFNTANTSLIAIGTGVEGVISGTKISLTSTSIDTAVYNIPEQTSWGIFTTGKSLDRSTSFEEAVIQEEKYRIININEDQDNNFSIAGIEYNESKYLAVESGISFDTLQSQGLSVFPQPPAVQNYSLSYENVTSNTIRLKISVVPPTDETNVSYYVVLAKSSSNSSTPFSSNIPSDPTVLSTNVFKQSNPIGYIIPNVGGQRWWFRVYSVNPRGDYSATFPADKYLDVPISYPIRDIKIHSLRMETDTTTINLSASDDATQKEFTVSEPVFFWNADNPNNLDGIKYQAGIRKNNVVYPVINIKEETFKFNFLANLLTNTDANYTYIDQYSRNYSVYVEAYDGSDNSSKGNKRQDLTFTSPNNGYDLISVNNGSLNITPFEAFGASLTMEGLVSVYNLPKDTDAAGFYVFYSLNNFNYSSDIKNQDVSFISNKKIFVKKFYGVNDVSFSLASNSDLNLGGFPSVTTDTLYIAIAPFDQIDELKGVVFSTYKGKESTLGLKPFYPSNWLQGTSLIGSSTKLMKRSTPEYIRSIGQGFKAWIRIREDGSWVGKGISKVEAIDSSVVYPGFKGYSPFNCAKGNLNPSATVILPSNTLFTRDPKYIGTGAAPVTSPGTIGISSPSASITFPHQDFSHFCGWLSNPVYQTYTSNETALKATNLFNYRGGIEDSVNTDSTNPREAIGFKRYRITFDSLSKPIDDNYAIIGINANNKKYQTFDQIADKYGIVNDLMQGGYNLQLEGKYRDLGLILQNQGNSQTYQNEVFSDSPWWKNHPAGFGQGWGGLNKNKNYFDVHMGNLVDFSYLREAFFAVVSQDELGNNFKTKESTVVNTLY